MSVYFNGYTIADIIALKEQLAVKKEPEKLFFEKKPGWHEFHSAPGDNWQLIHLSSIIGVMENGDGVGCMLRLSNGDLVNVSESYTLVKEMLKKHVN